MKYVMVVVAVFILAFGVTCLLEFEFIAKNWLRYALVVLLVLFILATGFYVLKNLVNNKNQ